MKGFYFILFSLVINQACSQSKLEIAVNSLINFSVDTVRAQSFKELIKENPDLVILDTRAINEFETSHIEKAKFIDYESFNISDVEDIDKDKVIVTYCSVGYRSEQIGKKLKENGFSRVYNLYGGIFDWKNKGYDVVNKNGTSTDSVHVYNTVWSVFLEEGIKVYE